jgi:hypothetical protein
MICIAICVAGYLASALGFVAHDDLGIPVEHIRDAAVALATVIASLLAIDHFGKKFRKGGAITLTTDDFAAAILEDEIILRHKLDGHVFHFPISSDGRVSMQGLRIEANPNGSREARGYVRDAHKAALAVLGSEQV